MRKLARVFAGIFATASILSAQIAHVDAPDPKFVLLRFENDTRFQSVDSASVLSDLVMEKLLMTGKFDLRASKPIDANVEKELFDIKSREVANLKNGVNAGTLTKLFEGPGFDETQAQTLSTAKVGQIISPEITSKIGEQHGAEYLIQGTVMNLGSGGWFDEDAQRINQALSYLNLGGVFDRQVGGIGVQVDLRLIESKTGKVLWNKKFTGKRTRKALNVHIGFNFKFGSTKLDSDMYSQAMDIAAEKSVNALVRDLESGELFGEVES